MDIVEAATANEDGPRTAYEGVMRLYRIDDGERHVYAAASAWEALREHMTVFGGDEAEEFTVRELPGDEELVVGFEDEGDTKHYSAALRRGKESAGWVCSLAGPAAEWAVYYEPSADHRLAGKDNGAFQVSSTCH